MTSDSVAGVHESYLAKLDSQLAALPGDECRLAFGLACCERNIANYVEFRRVSGWGNVRAIVEANEQLWRHIQGSELSQSELAQWSRLVGEAYPEETESFSPDLVPDADVAGDVCSLLLNCLDFAKLADPAKIRMVAVTSLHIVSGTAYVECSREWSDRKGREWVQDHFFSQEVQEAFRNCRAQADEDRRVKAEIDKQFENLAELQTLDRSPSAADIERLRKASTFGGMSNLGFKL